jgi:NitT/TauT family transport system substrate-binding protein
MLRQVVQTFAAAIALAAMSVGGAAQTPVKLVLDFAIQGQQSPLVLAADGSYFSRAGVEVQVDRGYGSADAVSKLSSGAYDMAFADIGVVIQFNAKQGATKVIDVFQVYDVAPMVVLSLKKSGITKPTDLAGKRIASPAGASSRVMFPAFAAANNIDVNSVKWVDVTPQLRETLLVQGQTDATTALVTDLAGLKHLNISENDLTVMRFADYGVNIYGHALITTPEFAAKHPDIVKKVVKGVAEALKASIANPDIAIAAIKKRDPLVDDDLERHRLQLVLKNAIVTDHVKKAGLSAVEMERMKKTAETVTTAFKLPPVDAAAIYRPEFLPPIPELKLP